MREAVFGALEARDVIAGSRVFDLYAGSGALGLEALSRGSGPVTLVEKNSKAAAVVESNARMVREAGRLDSETTRVVCSTVAAFLASLSVSDPERDGADLIFIDPPYDLDNDSITIILETIAPFVREYGVIVLERSTRSPMPDLPVSLVLDRTTKYGETSIHWIGRAD